MPTIKPRSLVLRIAISCGLSTMLAVAEPQASRRSAPASRAASASGVTIALGAPEQVLHRGEPDSLGLFNVPDMHTALFQRPDKSYWVWITGNIGPVEGAIARLSTSDFLHYENAGPGTARRAEPVMTPTCRTPSGPARGRAGGRRATAAPVPDRTESCEQNYDADYVGANAVIAGQNGKDLLMLYEAGNKTTGTTTIPHGWEYNVIALARSTDEGFTWRRQGVIVSGADPKPTSRTTIAQPGTSEPGALVAGGYLYLFYQYIANQASDTNTRSVIEVARSPLTSDAAPGSWSKYYEGAFSQPGLGGRGSSIVPTGSSGCTRPVEVWPATSTYLGGYVLALLCDEGWFFSTSTDLVTWTPPENFLPMAMWQACKPMDWNYVLVTPGNKAGVIGQRGYVLYAHSDAKGLDCPGGFSPHMLWVRPFTFSKTP